MASVSPEQVIAFWFGDPPYQPQGDLWWRGGAAADQQIREQFGASVDQALAGQLDRWPQQAESALALVILLDQFTRNMFRRSAQAFAGDQRARAVTLAGLEAGYLDQLHYLQSVFFCMPLEHAESIELQDRCVTELTALQERNADDPTARKQLSGFVDHACQHRDLIARFGRFPHRNEVLQRPATPEETAFLAQGGQRFGQ